MKKTVLASLGFAVAVLALGGRISGPYTLELPPDGNPAAAASTACQDRAAGLALVLTVTRDDGVIDVVYRCERP
jgi:hypothetical protein